RDVCRKSCKDVYPPLSGWRYQKCAEQHDVRRPEGRKNSIRERANPKCNLGANVIGNRHNDRIANCLRQIFAAHPGLRFARLQCGNGRIHRPTLGTILCPQAYSETGRPGNVSKTLRRHAFSGKASLTLVLDHGPIDRRVFSAESTVSRASIVVAAPWIRARRHPPPPRPSRLARLLQKKNETPLVGLGSNSTFCRARR